MKTFLKLAALLLLLFVAGAATFYLHPLFVSDTIIRSRLWRAGVKSEYVEAGGYRLHYLEALPPANAPDRPILLIPGLGARGEDWAPLIPGLAAAGFHVYAPDLLGYGRSPRPDVDYSMRLEEKVVVDFMNAMHLTRPDIAGWSMGGWVSMKLAVEHPDRVDRLLLYDSAGVYFPPTFDTNLFAPTDRAGLARLMSAISARPRAMPGFVQDDALRKLRNNSWIVNRSMTAMVDGRDLMDFRLHLIRSPRSSSGEATTTSSRSASASASTRASSSRIWSSWKTAATSRPPSAGNPSRRPRSTSSSRGLHLRAARPSSTTPTATTSTFFWCQ